MRLLTRSDFDGLMCAVLLKELGLYEEIKYVHPKDIQDGKVEVSSEDMLVNIPFVPGCGMWFDHHTSEEERGLMKEHAFEGSSWPAPSCARVVYEYYGGDTGTLGRFRSMISWADKCDSAQFTREEILNPKGWVLLSFIMDPRTGLGYHKEYRISNYSLMEELVEHLRYQNIEAILELPDVQERILRYREHQKPFEDYMRKHSRAEGNAIITDLRGTDEHIPGNRHVIYALFPDQNISLRVFDGKNREFCVFSVGHSILNRTSGVDVGKLLLRYGGGGHFRVGTCQVPYEEAEKVLREMLEVINRN
ncbi:MAG TPA: exopolyphosphatase [Synergistaceae bacterium]|nr:exopolyphosphatase [Synergistaceae bacterium]HPJ24684.1 exopolyphosphatase [Synergistaceae bacterium]HPQ37513.1 exopolyphosphatase [Synergistaceae bacterium]